MKKSFDLHALHYRVSFTQFLPAEGLPHGLRSGGTRYFQDAEKASDYACGLIDGTVDPTIVGMEKYQGVPVENVYIQRVDPTTFKKRDLNERLPHGGWPAKYWLTPDYAARLYDEMRDK